MLRVLLGIFVGTVSLWSTASLAQTVGSPLVSEIQAQHVGLTRAWFTRAQVDPSRGRIGSVVLHGGGVFVQTDQGILQAFDSETGRTLWTVQVGQANYPTMSPAVNDRFVACTNGSTIYTFNRVTGEFLWQRKLAGAPAAGASANKDKAYVPMVDGSVEAYKFVRANPADETPLIVFGKGMATQAPVVEDKRLTWGTASGFAFSDNLLSVHMRFRVKTEGPIVAPLTHRAPMLYIGSKDGYLYAVNDLTGSLIWKFSAGSSIVEQPVAVDGAVYTVADAGGMFRLDPKNGREVWWVPEIKKFLAASKLRVYASDIVGRLVVIDAASGARLAMLPTEALDLKVCNTLSDRVFIGTRTGVLQCLHERELSAPLSHAPPVVDEKAKGPAKPASAAPAEGVEQPAAPAAGASPFGAPGAP